MRARRFFVAAVTILLGASLLFFIQPLIGRQLLPRFGGAPMVWMTCLLFFQTGLLVGYFYAHGLTSKLGPAPQSWCHGALLLVSLAFVPLDRESGLRWVSERDPTLSILLLLVTRLSLPFVLLAATGPLVQKWLASDGDGNPDDRSLYRLYALSNLGSLGGLLVYPFVAEPFLTVRRQSMVFSMGYALFALVSFAFLWLRRGASKTAIVSSVDGNAGERSRWIWLTLPMAGAIVLLATTNHITRNVAAVPFLWVLPLALYLVTYILAFERDRWYHRGVFWVVFVSALGPSLYLIRKRDEVGLVLQLALFCGLLVAGCMICHGELARSRPRPEKLTQFYLCAATGGALGGLFVSVLSPLLFSGFWEFPLSLAAVYAIAGWIPLWGGATTPENGRLRYRRLLWVGGLWSLLVVVGDTIHSQSANTVFMRRSFYGVVRIYDGYPETPEWQRYLWNGPIGHGSQYLEGERRRQPTMYYGPRSGIAKALRFLERQSGEAPRRVGVVGLGAGTLASFGRVGDRFRFYEINPDVVTAAEDYFYYLRDSEAIIEIVTGDGRLALARELEESGSLELDLLAIDAFSGDAIPMHLLTREAFELYQRHLRPDGILAVHISNLHLDLGPVVRAQAEALGTIAVLVASEEEEDSDYLISDWVLMTSRESFFLDPELSTSFTPWVSEPRLSLPDFLWTDDYSNLLQVVKD